MPPRGSMASTVLAGALALGAAGTHADEPPGGAARAEPVRSADWIAALPEGPTRRQVVLGCTPCHQLGPPVVFRATRPEWHEIIARMKKIDDDLDLALIPLDAAELADWLGANARMPERGFAIETRAADIREYPAGAATGFYHDVAIAAGRAWIADYFGNRLYGVDLDDGAVETFDLPVDVAPGKPAGAHQIDTTRDGLLWITFTKSEQVIRFDPHTKDFRVYSGFEPGGNVQYFVMDAQRRIYQDADGGIWFTHFAREQLSRLDPDSGAITVFETPRTEHLAEKAVHLYAAVADSRGRLWYTETHGNRFGMLDPRTGAAQEWEMPEAWSGPKRLAIDTDDRLWIPELATGRITVYDTRAGRIVDRLRLPIPGDYPYAIRRNPYSGDLWVTGAGSDSLYRLDPATRRFDIYRLPRQGAYPRTVAFTEDGAVWTNYASFPNAHTRTPHQAGTVVRLMPK